MSLKKQLKALERNRPEYKINSEATDNQAIATNAAYARDNAVVNAEKQVSQNAADAVAQAKNASSNSAGILAAVSGINANTNNATAGLAQQESAAQARGKEQLMQANAAMIEEKDKAFDYNVNQPYQNKIAEIRDKRKHRQEMLMKGIDVVGALAGTAIAASTGGASTAAKAAAVCWVAREIYGETNPEWLTFRTWLVTRAPKWFRELYTEYGEDFALFLKKYPFIKPILKPFFDSRVRYMNSLTHGLQTV